MATGRSTQLTRQISEHLIVAKLGRLGYIATPFAGNVPDFDLLIADEKGHSIPIQVKAINGGSWQFQISKFLNIEIVDDVQYIKGKQKLANPNLICRLPYTFEFRVIGITTGLSFRLDKIAWKFGKK